MSSTFYVCQSKLLKASQDSTRDGYQNRAPKRHGHENDFYEGFIVIIKTLKSYPNPSFRVCSDGIQQNQLGNQCPKSLRVTMFGIQLILGHAHNSSNFEV